MSEISRPKPLPWYYGLVPPLWMVLQMVIMFSNSSELVTGTIWTYLWGLEALVTYAAMMWWLMRRTGKKSPRTVMFFGLSISWIVFCYVLDRIVEGYVPRPNYSQIPSGNSEEYMRLVHDASHRYATQSLVLTLVYNLIIIGGLLLLSWLFHRKNLFGRSEFGS